LKTTSKWYSGRIGQQIQVVRWGTVGVPVLLFPTAGGDAEEVERFLLIRALAPLMDAGKIKVYSCDSVAGRAWLSGEHSAADCAKLQNGFDGFVYHELVAAIREDCNSREVEVIVGGASIGAFNAVAAICRHPDVFSHAIGMSGTYDPERYLRGEFHAELYFSSPLHFLPGLEGEPLDRLRQRFVILTHGQGRWEDPGESWRMAEVLGSRGVPNRVDPWDETWDHDWPTWRAMLPRYLEELT
jgi:esterase/lipase superfamily enzyme